jgi:hypothetical protein
MMAAAVIRAFASAASAPTQHRNASLPPSRCSHPASATARFVQRSKPLSRSAERDLARAYDEITAEAEAERPTLAARIADRVWRAMLRAERRKDDHLALAAADRLIKLAGLGGERVVISGTTNADDLALLEALRLTPAERVQQMAKDRAALAAANNKQEGNADAEEE